MLSSSLPDNPPAYIGEAPVSQEILRDNGGEISKEKCESYVDFRHHVVAPKVVGHGETRNSKNFTATIADNVSRQIRPFICVDYVEGDANKYKYISREQVKKPKGHSPKRDEVGKVLKQVRDKQKAIKALKELAKDGKIDPSKASFGTERLKKEIRGLLQKVIVITDSPRWPDKKYRLVGRREDKQNREEMRVSLLDIEPLPEVVAQDNPVVF